MSEQNLSKPNHITNRDEIDSLMSLSIEQLENIVALERNLSPIAQEVIMLKRSLGILQNEGTELVQEA